MATDRELLELAARAAGIEINVARQAERDAAGVDRGLWTLTATNWNPLTDDGDALRLAVKLKIIPQMDEDGVATGYERVTNTRRPYNRPIYEAFGDDELGATRRAIVRAAAEIGRAAQDSAEGVK